MSIPVTPDPLPAHSLIGASSISRLIACPASFRLSQQVPGGGGSSVHAARGTVAHALAEEAIREGYDPAREIGQTVTVDGHDITVDPEMVDAVAVYVAEFKRRVAGASFAALETRVCLDPYFNPPPPCSAFGTADTILYHGATQHLTVLDYKNGAGVFVDATDNPQLLYYAAGSVLEMEKLNLGPVLTVELVIVQPNIRGADKVRVSHTTALDVRMWVDDVLIPTVREAALPGARIAGGKHCRFCPARPACPALAKIAQELARRDFGPSDDEIIHLEPAELGKVLADAETVAPHIDGLREDAQKRLEDGEAVPGWRLVPSRPVRGWSCEPHVLAQALPAEFRHLVFDARPRTPAQLEKVLSPEMWEKVSPLVQSRSSGVRLMRDAADPHGSGSGTTRNAAQDDFA